MLKGTKKYWLVAMVCGLAASILFYRYLQDIEASYSPDKLVSVVVARTAIESDSRITADQLKIENIPARFAHPNALHDIKDVAGKITTGTLVAGQSILSQQLVNSTDKAKRLSYSIPNSQRAVSIAVNDVSGVSGFIKTGDRVDVVATVDMPDANGQAAEKVPNCVMVLQNLQVLAVGGNPEVEDKKSASVARTITLAVALADVQPLVLASERGSIRVLLRSPVDSGKLSLPAYQLKDLQLRGLQN